MSAHRTHDGDAEEPGIYIDVGEKSFFYVNFAGTVEYVQLHKSDCSIVLVSVQEDGCHVCIRVCWSRYKRVAQSKGYIGMVMCEGLSFVPKSRGREMCRIGSTYVEVTTRDYIEGSPLSALWGNLSPADKLSISAQVQHANSVISLNTSSEFMALQGANLATSDPVMCLTYKMLLSMIVSEIAKGCMRIVDMETFPCVPRLCHGNLSLDHIIVKDGSLNGIVGWSKCDFVPEVMDRVFHHFRHVEMGAQREWAQIVSEFPTAEEGCPPLYASSLVYYSYFLAQHRTEPLHHRALETALSKACDKFIPSVRETYMGMYPMQHHGGDRASQEQHEKTRGFQEECFSQPTPLHQEFLQAIDQDSTNPFSADSGCGVTEDTRTTVTEETWEDWTDNETVTSILTHLAPTFQHAGRS